VIDLLVAGAGPVGLAAAIRARLAGLDVVVVDPRTAPIDKACGEGLMPDALRRLQGLGVAPEGAPFTGIRYLAPGSSAVARFADGMGRGVRRTVLQEALHARALALGVEMIAGRVDSVTQSRDHIDAGGIQARHLIAADGLHSQVRSAIGIRMLPARWHRYGIRQHFAVEPWTDVVEVYWLPDAEVYVTPVGQACVGIAVLGVPPLGLREAIARIPSLAQRLGEAQASSELRGAGPMDVRTTARRRGRALLAGDAAGYVDALTGEGLRIGFAQADAAVSCIVRSRIEDYDEQWRRITRRYRMLTSGLLLAGRGQTRSAIVPAARAFPSAFARIVNAL